MRQKLVQNQYKSSTKTLQVRSVESRLYHVKPARLSCRCSNSALRFRAKLLSQSPRDGFVAPQCLIHILLDGRMVLDFTASGGLGPDARTLFRPAVALPRSRSRGRVAPLQPVLALRTTPRPPTARSSATTQPVSPAVPRAALAPFAVSLRSSARAKLTPLSRFCQGRLMLSMNARQIRQNGLPCAEPSSPSPQSNLFFRYAPSSGASGFTSGPK